MEGHPQSRAEVMRIGNLMGVDPEDIGFLAKLSDESLKEFREQLTDCYFEENPALKRFAALANMMPAALVAKMTVDAIGPIISARVVGEVDSKSAINVLKRVPIDFVTDTAVLADPRRIQPLFAETPKEISKAVADELVRRKEYAAIGLMIAFVEIDVMDHALQNASDIDVLYSSFLVEEKARLADGIALLSDERLASIVSTAAHEDMWLEALDLISHLETDEFRRIANQAMSLEPEIIAGMMEFCAENDLWYVGVPAVCLADDPTNVVEVILKAKPKVRKSLLTELGENDYDELLQELLTKQDTPEVRKFFAPVLG
jgi:hypothetical protein